MRRILLGLALVCVSGLVAHAQVVVYDPAVTFRNSVTATLKEYLLTVQREQHSQLRRMAQRLSMFTNLGKYTVPDAPRWRIHPWENNEAYLFSTAYNAALNYGDADGRAYLDVSQPVVSAADAIGRLTPAARRILTTQLATLDVAAAAAAVPDTALSVAIWNVSQASPWPSPSASSCSGSAACGQTSPASGKPSPSASAQWGSL